MRFQRHHFELGQSIITFLCHERFVKAGKQAVQAVRQDVEEYIRNHPHFEASHQPILPENNAPSIIRRMCEASAKVGVGPMASVAGAIAMIALEAILEQGASEAIVDNGGDIALCIQEQVRVGIFAGFKGVQNLAFEVKPREGAFGICTSSGTVGPSFSYGKCDAAIVISEDVLLADAAATALGNQVSVNSNLQGAFCIFDSLNAIEGAVAILGEKIGLWGTIPRLTRMNVNTQLITTGR